MPSIVDLVQSGGVVIDTGRRWQLSRVGRERLDAAVSLHDNAIRDGELLFLTTTPTPAPQWIQDDPYHAAVDAADTRCMPTRVAATAACLCTAVLGAAALVWSGTVTHATSQVITGAAIATTTAIGAVTARRAHLDPILCVTLSVISVVFAAGAGFHAVPAGPSTANSLLAAAVACSTSVLLLRLTRCGAVCLTSVATFTALTSMASACGVAWPLPVVTTGAALSALSLGTLAMAPRLSIAAAGLAPVMPSSDDGADDDPAPQVPRAVSAHRTLTGLVIGSSGAAALGAALVALDCAGDGRIWPIGSVFAVVVGLVTVLRARTHIDIGCRTALIVGGMGAIVSGGALVVVSEPGQANWVCLIAVATGLSILAGRFSAAVNPLVRRAVEVSEYLALAAVVPLACWIGGLYGLIRGVSVP
jgi:type VII secretion integral membrane protein EccD